MSTLKVNAIRGTGASSDAISVNSTDGTCTANLTNPRSFRNLIINGGMQVAQRGSSSTSDGVHTVDRFAMGYGGENEAPTQAQHDLTSSDTGPWEKGFRNSFHITNGNQTGGAGAGDYAQIIYKIEAQDLANSGWNYTSTSSYITLSFWVKSSVAQTYYVRLNAEDASKAYSFAISVTTSWQKITKSIPGNSNLVVNEDNGCGLALYFIPFYGTNFTTSGHTNDSWITDSGSDQVTDMTSTWWTTNDATFEVTGVQLEVGDTATEFEHRLYGDELQRCKRYFQMYANSNGKYTGITAVYYTSTHIECMIRYEPEMRATPSLIQGSGSNYYGVYRDGNRDDFDSFSGLNASDHRGGSLYNNTAVNAVSGQVGAVILNSSSAYISFSAEI